MKYAFTISFLLLSVGISEIFGRPGQGRGRRPPGRGRGGPGGNRDDGNAGRRPSSNMKKFSWKTDLDEQNTNVAVEVDEYARVRVDKQSAVLVSRDRDLDNTEFDRHATMFDFSKGKLGIRIKYRVPPAGQIGPGNSAEDPADLAEDSADADDENIDDVPADADDKNLDDVLAKFDDKNLDEVPVDFDGKSLDDILAELDVKNLDVLPDVDDEDLDDSRDDDDNLADADDEKLNEILGEDENDQDEEGQDQKDGEEDDQPAGFFGFFKRLNRARPVDVCFVGNTVATMNQSMSEMEKRETMNEIETGTRASYSVAAASRLTAAQLKALSPAIARFCCRAARLGNVFQLSSTGIVVPSTTTTTTQPTTTGGILPSNPLEPKFHPGVIEVSPPSGFLVSGLMNPANPSLSIPYQISMASDVQLNMKRKGRI